MAKLTLTWANKNKTLITTPEGSYEWVEPSDPRANEVRLLVEKSKIGAVNGTPSDNLLIRGDTLEALRSLTRIPEYAAEYRGKVKLIYIDPPFNTGQAFEHYDDGLEHSVWLGLMRERLRIMKDLLATDGTIWLHLDDVEMAYAKVVMDEIFGRANFITSIAWEKAQGARNDTDISSAHDHILVYSKSARSRFKEIRNLIPRAAHQLARYQNPDGDFRGPWRQGDNGTAKSGNDDARFEITLPSGRTVVPPAGTYWRFSKRTFDAAVADGRVWFGKSGDSLPVVKRYLSEVQDGVVPRTWWPATEVGSNQEAKRDHFRKLFPEEAPFSTPKPERLLQRIIHIATNAGDIVLDAFAGSGSTAAVAHKMGRRWVTTEIVGSTVDTYTRPRLERVVDGADPGGISSIIETIPETTLPEEVTPEEARIFSSLLAKFAKVIDTDDLPSASETVSRLRAAARTKKIAKTLWTGGGGFRELEVSQPVFEFSQVGTMRLTTIRKDVGDAALGESIAAQLGYTLDFEPEWPFVGRKGRSRLAVIRGVLDANLAQALLAGVSNDESLTIAATSVSPDVRETIHVYAKGSRILRLPTDLFSQGNLA